MIKHYTQDIPLRLFFVILFIFLPGMIAYAIPAQAIYSWKENPIVMDKPVYESCEPITWTVHRRSILSQRVRVTERIIDGSPVADRSYSSVVSPTSGYKRVRVAWNNLCLMPDIYILEGVIEFELFGFDKSYYYQSKPFYVVEKK